MDTLFCTMTLILPREAVHPANNAVAICQTDQLASIHGIVSKRPNVPSN